MSLQQQESSAYARVAPTEPGYYWYVEMTDDVVQPHRFIHVFKSLGDKYWSELGKRGRASPFDPSKFPGFWCGPVAGPPDFQLPVD